jgi:hypothetical protein
MFAGDDDPENGLPPIPAPKKRGKRQADDGTMLLPIIKV